MAAIDPSAQPDDMGDSAHPPRATLKIIRAPGSPDESEMDSEDEEQLRKLIAGDLSDDDNDESDEESKAGPSDPSKALKVKQEKAAIDLKKALEDEEDEDVKMNGHHGINGTSSNAKGKQRATEADEDDEDELDLEQFVLCTLDPVKVGKLLRQRFLAMTDWLCASRTISSHSTSSWPRMKTSSLRYLARTPSTSRVTIWCRMSIVPVRGEICIMTRTKRTLTCLRMRTKWT